jgi:hypothetical protein
MLFRGTIIGPASGKLNGIVASHNRGGQYFRTHVIPTDPATDRQLVCRSAIASAYSLWEGLSAPVRQSWQNYAALFRRPNRLGDPRSNIGWTEFSRTALPRIQANAEFALSLADISVPPALSGMEINPAPTCSIASAGTIFRVTYALGQSWQFSEENILLLYLSSVRTSPGVRGIASLPATRNWFRGPYQLATYVLGDSGDPLEGELDFTMPDTVPEGARVFYRIRISSLTQGLSPVFEGVAVRTT